MINDNYLHVHQECPKCDGCIFECAHRVKSVLTTNATDSQGKTPDYLANHTTSQQASSSSPAASDNVDKGLLEQFDAMVKGVWEIAVGSATKRDDEYLALKDATRADVSQYAVKIVTSREQELLSRVREEVIGEDETLGDHEPNCERQHHDVPCYCNTSANYNRNHLRDEQRQKLNKLGDSL